MNCNTAKLSSKERHAVDREIRRQISEQMKRMKRDLLVLNAYVLSEQFGFGEKRLGQYAAAFGEKIDELIQRYSIDKGDEIWFCEERLRTRGIDVDKLTDEYGMITSYKMK